MSVISRLSSASFRCSCMYMQQVNSLLKPSNEVQRATVRLFKQQQRKVPDYKKPEVKVKEKLVKEDSVKQRDAESRSDAHEDRPILHYLAYTAAFVPCALVGASWLQHRHNHRIMMVRAKILPLSQKDQKQSMHLMHQTQLFKLIYGAIAINCCVTLFWRLSLWRQVERVSSLMGRYLLSLPVRGNSIFSTTLSSFSHHSIAHLLVNMYVLHSFSSLVYRIQGPYQSTAFYLSAATVSGTVSCIAKRFRGLRSPSLGASGAIMGIIGLVCTLVPKAELQIAFVNQIVPHSFYAENALIAVILLDVAGLVLGWKRLDHAAHLGGALFGIAYARYGRQSWTFVSNKVAIIHNWIMGIK